MRSIEGKLTHLRMQRVLVEETRKSITADIARKKMWLTDTEDELDEIDTAIMNLSTLLESSSTAS